MPRYCIEYFHIYIDEMIGVSHCKSLDYARLLKQKHGEDASLTVFIDNYNPSNHILSVEDILIFLKQNHMKPDFWAYEADLVSNAKKLLNEITHRKLRANCEKYIYSKNKYPCSLLAASWYLTRLGIFESDFIKSTSVTKNYIPAENLINILPHTFETVENRVVEIIKHSPFQDYLNNIENIFYPIDGEPFAKRDL